MPTQSSSLLSLLSQTLVAFTIEFDNEFEHRMPHRTTNHGGRTGPWLVSMVMWFNCMRYVTDEPISVGELEKRARTATNLNGMERWRYVSIEPRAEAIRRKTRRSEWRIRATVSGIAAREVWNGLFDIVEERWSKRFGEEAVQQLRQALEGMISRLDPQLPDCLPILGYGLSCKVPEQIDGAAENLSRDSPPLVALLAKVLLAFALDFERESALSLAISANVLRVLNEAGVRVRDLPVLSGASKEAVAMAMGILEKRRFVVVQSEAAGSRTKAVRLTQEGSQAKATYQKLLTAIEEHWKLRFGPGEVEALYKALKQIAGEGDRSRLFEGREPYSEGWRAQVPRPDVLPHFPLVLHRGGFPDGS